MDFAWDEPKRLSNPEKHRLDFLSAVLVFEGQHIRAPTRTVGGEARWVVTGTLQGRYVTIICTYRNELCRIISFRSARNAEKKQHQAIYG